MKAKRLAFAVLPLLLLGACATPRSLSLETAASDPWEASNRRVYAFNKKADRYFLSPVAKSYRAVVPKPARTGITNLYGNYREPSNFMNYVLQGKISRAFRTVDRFLLNTVLGVGGLADVATDLGRPRDQTDFGQTFSQWNIAAGPYLMLPFLGPSTLRDGIGVPFDFFVDPADIARNALLNPSIWWRGGQIGLRLVDARARLTASGADGLLEASLDEYATVRSAYLQSRRAELYYGDPPPSAEELEYYSQEAAEEAAVESAVEAAEEAAKTLAP